MNKIYANRLLKLADYLDTKVPAKAFNMETWLDRAPEDQDVKNPLPHALKEPNCGTTACALGWAVNVFPRTLTFTRWDDVVFRDEEESEEVYSRDTIRRFFGIEDDEAIDRLFYGDQCTPKQKARQIRKFVKERV